MKANQDVTLRINTETSGDGNVRSLADEIDRLSEAGGELAPKFRALAEELRKIESTQGLVEAFAKLKRETGEAATALEQAQAKAQALGREFTNTENPSRALTSEFSRARKEVQQAQAALQAKQVALQRMRGDLKAAGVDTKSLAEAERRLREELVEMEQRGQIATQVLGDMGREAQTTGADLGELAKQGESASEAFANAAANFTAGTVAIKGLQGTFGPATKLAVDFSTAMAKIRTNVDNPSDIPGLGAKIRELNQQFGTGLNSNAEALYDIVSAGITDTGRAVDTLTVANKLAIGGITDVAVAADGLTSTLNAYGEAAGTATNVSDAFFVAALAGKSGIDELAAGIGKVAPLAAQTGTSLDDLMAAISTLTLAGVETSEAITQVRAILTAVVKPSKQAATLAEELGLNYNLAALKAQGFAGFLEQMRKATGGNADQLAILLGSTEALSAALALTGGQAGQFADILDQMANKAGSTEAAFKTMTDTPEHSIRLFNSALEDTQLAVGLAVTSLTPLLEGITAIIGAFNRLPDGIQTTVAALGSVAVAGPVVLFALKSYAAAWQSLRKAMAISAPAAVARKELTATAAAATASAASMTRAAGAVSILGRGLSLLGGPIGLLLGAAALLIPAFTKTGDAAEHAAQGTGDLAEKLTEDAENIEEAGRRIAKAEEDRLAAAREHANKLTQIKAEETGRLQVQLNSQVLAYRETNKAIETAQRAREAAEKRRAQLKQSNKEFAEGLGQGGSKQKTGLDAQYQITQARGALGRGDLEGAIKQAERAKQIVQQLDQSGQESAYVLQYLAKQIAQVQDEAAAGLEGEADANIKKQQAHAEELLKLITQTVADAEYLKMLEIGFDQAGAEASADQLRAALEAKLAANPIVIPTVIVDPVTPDAATSRLLGDTPARAYGGPLPGTNRGDRSDHVVYRGTPGEWVIQRPAVRVWGDENMRRINRGEMPRFAYGGELGGMPLAARVAIPSVETPSPATLPPLTGRPLVLPDGSQVPVYTDARIEEKIVSMFTKAALQVGRRR
ncbi:phage tail tape measure protein [Thauera sp.]|uniref:phage tail tape measure protein n=1 Tax=Thauera sp. TaxID=1905334 RepID=UPI0039E64D1C